MGAVVAEGALVGHPDFGRGKVLGVSEKKGAIRVRFDRAGIKELAYPCRGLTPFSPRDAPAGRSVVRLHLDRGPKSGPGCRWLLEFPEVPMPSLVRDLSVWANSKARLNGAAVGLHGIEKRLMELRISGQGRDGRCRWCRTFRSGLRTAVRRGYGGDAFAMEEGCVFDTGNGGRAPRSVAGDSGRCGR